MDHLQLPSVRRQQQQAACDCAHGIAHLASDHYSDFLVAQRPDERRSQVLQTFGPRPCLADGAEFVVHTPVQSSILDGHRRATGKLTGERFGPVIIRAVSRLRTRGY
jgi:hypothetical protein